MPSINETSLKRLLKDLTGKDAVKRTPDEARALQQALRDATRRNKELYTTRPNWQNGRLLTGLDANWILPVLATHGVSVPGSTDPGGRGTSRWCGIKYDFMPYTIVERGADNIARTILELQIPAPRDPFLPPPGLTTEEVLAHKLHLG